MYELYEEGATLAEVGDAFGITRERVRQLFRAASLHVRTPREAALLKRAKAREGVESVVVERFLELRDVRAVAREAGVSQPLAKEILDKRLPDHALMRRGRPPQLRYSEADVLACLREASQRLGGVLTTAAYTEFARGRRLPDGREWPTHQTAFLRFSSWRAALAAAGLRANPSSPIAGQRIFEQAHCIDALREVRRVLGKIPTAQQYDDYARKLGGAIPSLATVRNRCGGWQPALRLAYLD